MTLMPRIPFHYGLFYHAAVGLIGREPDTHNNQGVSGSYRLVFKPRNGVEKSAFPKHAARLAEWLDHFDLTFSGTCCEYGKSRITDTRDDVLEIVIKHHVEPKK